MDTESIESGRELAARKRRAWRLLCQFDALEERRLLSAQVLRPTAPMALVLDAQSEIRVIAITQDVDQSAMQPMGRAQLTDPKQAALVPNEFNVNVGLPWFASGDRRGGGGPLSWQVKASDGVVNGYGGSDQAVSEVLWAHATFTTAQSLRPGEPSLVRGSLDSHEWMDLYKVTTADGATPIQVGLQINTDDGTPDEQLWLMDDSGTLLACVSALPGGPDNSLAFVVSPNAAAAPAGLYVGVVHQPSGSSASQMSVDYELIVSPMPNDRFGESVLAADTASGRPAAAGSASEPIAGRSPPVAVSPPDSARSSVIAPALTTSAARLTTVMEMGSLSIGRAPAGTQPLRSAGISHGDLAIGDVAPPIQRDDLAALDQALFDFDEPALAWREGWRLPGRDATSEPEMGPAESSSEIDVELTTPAGLPLRMSNREIGDQPISALANELLAGLSAAQFAERLPLASSATASAEQVACATESEGTAASESREATPSARRIPVGLGLATLLAAGLLFPDLLSLHILPRVRSRRRIRKLLRGLALKRGRKRRG